MSKFLNTSAVTYHLEELIKNAHERLILISPYLKLNDRIRELLEDRDRMKIDIRIVYGKSDLQPEENNWLKSLTFVRTSFCKNLHAKCYMNENQAIVTSMNLYEFSQVNNNEMGVLIERISDPELYQDTHQEVQRLIRISDEVKVTVEKINRTEEDNRKAPASPAAAIPNKGGSNERKLSPSKLAQHLKMPKRELDRKLLEKGLIERDGDKWKLTAAGIAAGGEAKVSPNPRIPDYIAWPETLEL